MGMYAIRLEIDHMRRQITRQRKDIFSLQKAGISSISAKAMLARMHDKVDVLVAGVTRSAYIERVLLHHARFVEGADLDNIGRRIPVGLHHPNKSMAKMGSQVGPMLPNGKPAIRYPSDENPLTEGEPGEDG